MTICRGVLQLTVFSIRFFRGTGYNVRIVDKLYANRFENAGDGDTVLNLLQEG